MASASLSARLAPRALLPLSARLARPTFAAHHRNFHQSPTMASKHAITTLDVCRVGCQFARALTLADLVDPPPSRVFSDTVRGQEG